MDVVTEGRRLVEAHRARDEAMDRARRYVEAMAEDPDPIRQQIAEELTVIVGLPCLTCGRKTVSGPVCDNCTDAVHPSAHQHINNAGAPT